MKILLISDVHANISALRAIEKDAGPADAVWCAGDLTDFGTDPHEAIAWIRDHDTRCVIGNHDKHLLSVYDAGEAVLYRGTPSYQWVHDNCDRLTDEDILYLRNLPRTLFLEADGIRYQITHQIREGSYDVPNNADVFDRYFPENRTDRDAAGGAATDAWENKSAASHTPVRENAGVSRRLILGHTHQRCVHILDEWRMWLNPGSVSYRRPDDLDKRAQYMLLENGMIRFRAVPYDRKPGLRRTLFYVRNGGMMDTNLQDAMFFFGDAKTTRDPLLRADQADELIKKL